MNLSDILKDLNIPIEGEKPADSKVDFEKFDTSKLPDEAKTVFKTMLDTINDSKNQLAGKDLVINTLKTVHVEKPVAPAAPAEEITDPVLKEIQDLKNELATIKRASTKTVEETFKDGIKSLVSNKETQDVVRFVPEMKTLLQQHPSLATDVNGLYYLAKLKSTGGKTKEKDETVNQNKKVTEMSTFANRDVASAKRYSSLEEAYDAAASGSN